MNKILDTILNLLKKIIIIYSDEDMEEGFEITRAEVIEAINAFNLHKKEWEELRSGRSPIEERMLTSEEVVKKSLADPARTVVPTTGSGLSATKTYASVVAPPMVKTVVRIRAERATDLQPQELL